MRLRLEFRESVSCQQVSYLQGLNIPNNSVCNMVSRAPRILAQDLEQNLKPVVSFIEGRGVTGEQYASSLCGWLCSVLSCCTTRCGKVSWHISGCDSCWPTAGTGLAQLLAAHPKLLLYTVSSDDKVLQLGRAFAQVDVVEKNGQRSANVSYWREGASFITAPLSPWRPGNSCQPTFLCFTVSPLFVWACTSIRCYSVLGIARCCSRR